MTRGIDDDIEDTVEKITDECLKQQFWRTSVKRAQDIDRHKPQWSLWESMPCANGRCSRGLTSTTFNQFWTMDFMALPRHRALASMLEWLPSIRKTPDIYQAGKKSHWMSPLVRYSDQRSETRETTSEGWIFRKPEKLPLPYPRSIGPHNLLQAAHQQQASVWVCLCSLHEFWNMCVVVWEFKYYGSWS